MNLDGWKIEFYDDPVQCEKGNLLMVLNASENIIPNIGDVFWFAEEGREVVRRHINYETKTITINGE